MLCAAQLRSRSLQKARLFSLSRVAQNATATSTSTPPPPPPPPPQMVELEVDGKKVQVEPGTVLIRACEEAGVEIPRFCYHERLAVAGNCRMCLVEVEKSPKPVASCAMPVAPGMKIKTNTPIAKKAREGVMEFLLANHPLDCPICDQGGECDLQDQSMVYGSDRSRFVEPAGKRAVEDKDLGPLVKTVMTRCIHCTRCVRFANEIAGAEELGTSGRGNQMEIGTYIEKTLSSEMSGNIIDLCPVGALTSKPYSFTTRPWELRRVESIDVLDAVGSNIRVDSRGSEVMRILPRLNEEVNEEWLADKSRFAYDGLKRQRLLAPMIRQGNKFVQVSWEDALSKVSEVLSSTPGNRAKAIAGQLADAESMIALKDLFNRIGSSNLYFEGENGIPAYGADVRSNYLLNSKLNGIEKADALLLVGTNPKHEAPIYNARIRKSYLHFGLNVGLIGEKVKLTCEYEHLGNDVASLTNFAKGKVSSTFATQWKNAKRPLIVIGAEVTKRSDAGYIFSLVEEMVNSNPNLITNEWNGISVLQKSAARAAALDIGFVPGVNASTETPSFIYLLGADEISSTKDIPKSSFVVYQGHHGDTGANFADVILPGAAYTEKSGTYVNTEGRVQRTRPAVSAPGNAREDWKIIRALSEVVGLTLPYDTLGEVRSRLSQVAPHFSYEETIQSPSLVRPGLGALKQIHSNVSATPTPFTNPIKDYYLTDPISRASQTMAKCSAAFAPKSS